MFTKNQLELITGKLCNLGRVPRYTNQNIELSSTSTRRFIHDGCSVKRLKRSKALLDKTSYNQEYLGFGFNVALSVILQDDYDVYSRLFSICEKFDEVASTYVDSTEQSAVLFNHKSFGDRLFPHIHQRSTDPKPTISFFYNLTNMSDKLPVLTLLEPVYSGNKKYDKGYTDHKLLLLHERTSKKIELDVNSNDAIIFDAQNIPHAFTFTDDIWLVFVYDNVTLKDTIKSKYNYLFDSKSKYNVFSLPS
jgi:hypothetical protein